MKFDSENIIAPPAVLFFLKLTKQLPVKQRIERLATNDNRIKTCGSATVRLRLIKGGSDITFGQMKFVLMRSLSAGLLSR